MDFIQERRYLLCFLYNLGKEMVGTWKAMLCCPWKLMFPPLFSIFPRKHWGAIIVLLVEKNAHLESINVPPQNIVQPLYGGCALLFFFFTFNIFILLFFGLGFFNSLKYSWACFLFTLGGTFSLEESQFWVKGFLYSLFLPWGKMPWFFLTSVFSLGKVVMLPKEHCFAQYYCLPLQN